MSKGLFDFTLTEMDTALEILAALRQQTAIAASECLAKHGVCDKRFLNSQEHFTNVANTHDLLKVVRATQATPGEVTP